MRGSLSQKFNLLLQKLRDQIVQPVPADRAACLECGAFDCPPKAWLTCGHRLKTEEIVKKYRQQDSE